MRFTSLVVELIRARPRLVVWIVVLVQAALWLILPMLLYRSPPGDLATVLAFGREYQVGTWLGPPLAFWLADIAFRAAGNTMFGVYLLAQACAVATFWIYYQLARAIVGGQQAVLAVLLSMTVVAFSSPGVEFGPLVLARPLWALLLLHSWQLIGQNRRNAWFAWSIEAGLLLLTTSAAPILLLLLAGFAVATERGRRVLTSLDPLYALLVIVVLVLPYLIWLLRADAFAMPSWPAISDLGARATQWGWLLGGLVLAASPSCYWRSSTPAGSSVAPRMRRSSTGRRSIRWRAISSISSRWSRPLLGSLIAGIFNLDRIVGGAGVALLMAGLAVVVATGDLIYLRRQRLLRTVWAAAVIAPAMATVAAIVFLPWTGSNEVPTSLPAKSIAQFFGDSYERRTNQRLRAVAGDPQLASFVAMSRGRPHLLLDATPERTPWLTVAKFNGTGGVVLWRASDTSGAPPPEHRATLPGPGAGSAARLRVAGQRPSAAAARRLGHRAAESAVVRVSSW